jgi:hypothetical protein
MLDMITKGYDTVLKWQKADPMNPQTWPTGLELRKDLLRQANEIEWRSKDFARADALRKQADEIEEDKLYPPF